MPHWGIKKKNQNSCKISRPVIFDLTFVFLKKSCIVIQSEYCAGRVIQIQTQNFYLKLNQNPTRIRRILNLYFNTIIKKLPCYYISRTKVIFIVLLIIIFIVSSFIIFIVFFISKNIVDILLKKVL